MPVLCCNYVDSYSSLTASVLFTGPQVEANLVYEYDSASLYLETDAGEMTNVHSLSSK